MKVGVYVYPNVAERDKGVRKNGKLAGYAEDPKQLADIASDALPIEGDEALGFFNGDQPFKSMDEALKMLGAEFIPAMHAWFWLGKPV